MVALIEVSAATATSTDITFSPTGPNVIFNRSAATALDLAMPCIPSPCQ